MDRPLGFPIELFRPLRVEADSEELQKYLKIPGEQISNEKRPVCMDKCKCYVTHGKDTNQL